MDKRTCDNCKYWISGIAYSSGEETWSCGNTTITPEEFYKLRKEGSRRYVTEMAAATFCEKFEEQTKELGTINMV